MFTASYWLLNAGTPFVSIQVLFYLRHHMCPWHSELLDFMPGIADDWEGYLANMSDPSAWGGENLHLNVRCIKRNAYLLEGCSTSHYWQ